MNKRKTFTLYVLYDPNGTQIWRTNRSKKALIKDISDAGTWSQWYKNGWRIKKAKCTIIE
ncbi:hypothetical protein AB6805_30395 [Chitinophaga sp. RCC_12]|uniref:hypothetical protein n=1 Tax=Chitinophaga sp. RCC_12 TaxID=3239226 RepID=UPI00352648D7